MQTIERIPDGTACKVHHTRNRTSLPLRNRKEKKDCGAQRCRNHFLSTAFSNIVPGFLIKDYDGEPFNLKSATTRLYDTEAKIICIVSKKGAQCIECHHKDI